MKLTTTDVYDFYGLASLDRSALDKDALQLCSLTLEEIRRKYVEALKSRIIAEAGYIGIDISNVNSLEAMVGRVKEGLAKAIAAEADRMRMTGGGFKLAAFIQQAEALKPPDPMQTAAAQFRSDKGKSRQMYGGEPWARISEAFLAVDKAKTPSEIILAIDHLNDLQHNTNHVLFDITGHGAGIKEILKKKANATSITIFIDKMSKPIKELVEANT